jgi:hypothetical protein
MTLPKAGDDAQSDDDLNPYREDPVARRPTGGVRTRITFDGPEVAAGFMDARALGESMQALADYIDAAGTLTYGAGTSVTHEIEADFARGSFTFTLFAVAPEVHTGILDMVRSLTTKEFLEAIGLIGGGGVIGLLRLLKGKKAVEVQPVAGNNVQVTTGDGSPVIVNNHTYNVYNNTIVREALDGVMSPLKREGVTEFRAGQDDGPVIAVPQAEIGYFEPPPAPAGETLQNKVATEFVQVESLVFAAGKKWRFRAADGSTFQSAIDPEYTKKVLRHEEVFGHGDALEVEVRNVVTRDETGRLHSQRDIVKVLNKIPAKQADPQIPLFAVPAGWSSPETVDRWFTLLS